MLTKELIKKYKETKSVTVVIPTLNEAENIEYVLYDLKKMGYDVLIVDARSTDNTVRIAKALGARIIFQKGFGKGDALREAFMHQFVSGDIIVFMDADGSMHPKEIPSFISEIENGADLVKGSRFLDYAHSKDINLIRTIGNFFLLFVVNFLHDTNYSDLCYGFGAFRRSALNKILPYLDSKNFEIEAEVFIKDNK